MTYRSFVSLDGPWRFNPDPHADGESLGFWKKDYSARLWPEVAVLSCFEAGSVTLRAKR